MHFSKPLPAATWVLASLMGSLAQSVSNWEGMSVSDLASALQGLGLPVVQSQNASSHSCIAACDLLGEIFPSIVSTQGSSAYNLQQSKYWSNQQLLTTPACRIQPKNAVDVAATLLVSQFTGCPFAVKSGGHASFAGASNIQGGITIDLKNLNEITVSADQTLTRTGAGNRWYDVYSSLTPQNLSVVGGRVAAIGVGGLTLGGGISFFSGRHGWACDGVRNYEVVLANASIVNVNYTSHPDLYFALRGGGNNFGIVTRFDLETFPQGNMWGGATAYDLKYNASIFKAFENYAVSASNDPDAALFVAVAYAEGQYFFSNDYEYAKPVVNPPIFHEFTSLPNLTSSSRITNMTDLALELNASNPGGFRELYTTATFHNNATLMGKILALFMSEVTTIQNATGILPALVQQPITKDVISYFSKNGGNALGIAESDGPLNLMNLAIMWSDPADDARIVAAANNVIQGSIAMATKMGLNYKYIYQNYASPNENVFAGYGAANQAKLIQISKKYDPNQVFERLQPGYFKLDGDNGGTFFQT